MNKKEKAAQVLQHPDGKGQQTVLSGFELSEDDYIMAWEPAQGSIAAILSHGRTNALTTAELSKITGRKTREITRAICAERRMGAPILSDPGAGFWLAEDADEVRRCTAALHRRACEIHKTANALQRLVGRR